MARRVFLALTLVAIAIIITLITGLVVLVRNSFYFGIPVGWRLDYCPILAALYACPPYNWGAFVLDVLFYTALGYGLVLGYARYHASKSLGFPPKQSSDAASPT